MMMLPACNNLMRSLGWSCSELAGHPPALYVSTPLALPGGKPLDFYLTETRGHYDFTDDGLTMFGLRGLGFTLDDGRHWRGLATIAEDLGFRLDDSGAFVASFPADRLCEWSGHILRLFGRVLDWQGQHFAEADTDLSLTLEVERILRRKRPELPLVISPTAILPMSTELRFDFKWGETYVDAVSPKARTISSRLRKTVQFLRWGGERENLLFVVDDRDQEKSEAADREIPNLATLTRAVKLSNLERAA